MAPQHRQAAFTIGRVAGLHHHVKHQRAAPGAQVDLVAVVRLTPALADDVGVRLEQSLAGTFSPANTRRSWSSRQAPTSSAHHQPVPRQCSPSGHQVQQPPVGGRPPLRVSLLLDLQHAPLGRTAVVVHRHLRQALARLHSSRVSTRTPSYNRRLSDGSRISVSVTVLSIRACVPDSIPRCLASCNSTPLIACHVSASIAPTALCKPTSSAHGTDRPARSAARRNRAARTPTPDR